MIYFSPTNATRKVLHAIAKGIGTEAPKVIDLTRPEVREEPLPPLSNSLVILGVPVYTNRVPLAVRPCLNNIKGNGNLTIIIAVYGNIDEGIVLKQLNNIAESVNLQVIAAASFIGEHSFSRKDFLIAEGRPDKEDLAIAQDFGKKILEKIQTYENPQDIPKPKISGKLSFLAKISSEKIVKSFSKVPKVNKAACIQCGVCVKVCPMGAIDPETFEINEKDCIRCFACVKNCKEHARKIMYKKSLLIKSFLEQGRKKRRDPKIVI
ncbi:MAG: EFR1 family ferrodoxin [Candidatus Helarchaeota archaeon]